VCPEADTVMREKLEDRRAHFGSGKILHSAALMSTTYLRETSEAFLDRSKNCDGYKILYVFENVSGARIEQLSQFGSNPDTFGGDERTVTNEHEIRWRPPSGFQIRKSQMENGILVLYMTQLYRDGEDKRIVTYWRLTDAEMDISPVG
jgi:hypothetical protein